MPLVRITLSQNYSNEVIDTVSQAIHLALMEDFNVPKEDYFHIIEQREHSQLRFPDEYLGIKHNQDILFIQITAVLGRSTRQKQNLFKNIATKISNSTKVSSENIIITLIENAKENWSFGNGEVQIMNHI